MSVWTWFRPCSPLVVCLALPLAGIGVARGQVELDAHRVFGEALGADARIGAVADVDSDGRDDVVYVAPGGRVVILRNDGADDLEMPIEVVFGDDVAVIEVIDIDADGQVDLIACTESGSVEIRYADGAGGFEAPSVFEAASFPSALAIADANGDGWLDWAVSGVEIVVGLATGPRQFAITRIDPAVGYLLDIEIADVTGDGLADLCYLVGGSPGVLGVLAAMALGVWEPDTILAPGGSGGLTRSVLADADGDGRRDLLSIRGDALEVYLGSGDGYTWLASTDLGPGASFQSIVPFHVDSDAFVDVALVDFEGAVVVFRGLGNGTFELYSSADLSALDVVAADFDADGNDDIAVSRSDGEPRVTVYLSDGAGGVAQTVASPSERPGFMTVGDFDLDGDLDLVLRNNRDLSVLLGDGLGGFGSPLELPQDGVMSELNIKVGDFVEDGLPDLLALSQVQVDDEVILGARILVGDGSGAFAPMPPIPIPYLRAPVAIGDFDLDGHLDFVVMHRDDPLGGFNLGCRVFLGDGQGSFSQSDGFAVPGGRAIECLIDDADDDGVPDLITGRSIVARGVHGLHRGSGDGRFGLRHRAYWAPDSPTGFDIGNLDADVRLDCLIHGETLGVLIADPTVGFVAGGELSPGGEDEDAYRSASLVDLDVDGALDIVALGGHEHFPTGYVMNGDGQGSFELDEEFDWFSLDFRTGDVTNDGRLDIVGEYAGFPVCVAGGLDGGVRDGDESLDLEFPSRVAGAFLDEDGVADLALVDRRSDRLSIALGLGDGTFELAAAYPVNQPWDVATGDFDEDGHVDVVVTERGVSVFFGDGSGELVSSISILDCLEPLGLAVDDFDQDGHLDIAYGCSESDAVFILFGDGAGAFPDSVVVPGLVNPLDLKAAHVDGLLDSESRPDLVIHDFGTAAMTVVRNDGARNFSLGPSFPSNSFQRQFDVGDIDRDGHADIVFSVGTEGLEVRWGSGFGTYPEWSRYPFPGSAPEARLVDLDRDGQLEIVVSEGFDIRVLKSSQGRELVETGRFLAARVDWPGMIALDVDGDGHEDLVTASSRVFRNASFDVARCAQGNVNEGGSGLPHADPLRVEDSIGATATREIVLDAADSMSVQLDPAPVPRGSNAYYVGVWPGVADDKTVSLLPRRIGLACFTPVFGWGYVEPLFVANTIAPMHPRLDRADPEATGASIPGAVLVIAPGTFAPGETLTVQGMLEDGNSRTPRGVSVTNAVIVSVQ